MKNTRIFDGDISWKLPTWAMGIMMKQDTAFTSIHQCHRNAKDWWASTNNGDSYTQQTQQPQQDPSGSCVFLRIYGKFQSDVSSAKNHWVHWFSQLLPFGKRLHNCGKSPFVMGKSTISTGPFSIVFCMFTSLPEGNPYIYMYIHIHIYNIIYIYKPHWN